MALSPNDIVPVSFGFSPPHSGWIGLRIEAGPQSDEIACSDVYDPFPDLFGWARDTANGLQGCVEIDEEGKITQVWLTREPGSYLGRLRVFEPGADGQVEASRIDATVDVVQVALAYYRSFSDFVASHDAEQWSGRDHITSPLSKIDLRWLKVPLYHLGVLERAPGEENLYHSGRTSRDRYVAELGDRALAAVGAP